MELPSKIYRRLVSVVNRGRGEYGRKKYSEALSFFKDAEAIFPDPIVDYHGSEELYILFGDTLFEIGDFEKSREYYRLSQECIDKQQSLSVNFKIGKTYYQEDKYENAKQYFQIVFSTTGKEYFINEDAKYYYLVLED